MMDFSNNRIVNLFFCFYILGIVFYLIFSLNWQIENGRENRKFQEIPMVFKDGQINQNISSQTESYIVDHLENRDNFIDLYGRLVSAFDKRGNNITFIGRDNWLFERRLGNSHNFSQILYYQNKIVLSPNQLEKIRNDLKKVQAWCLEHNIKLYIMFPPDKQTIYKEYFPTYVKGSKEKSLVRVIEDYIREDVRVVSLEESFLKFKNKDFLHYKTEGHWSQAGGHLAYQLLMNEIQKDFKDVTLLDDKKFHTSMTAEVVSQTLDDGKRKTYKGNQFNQLGRPAYIPTHEKIYKKYLFTDADKIQIQSTPPYEKSLYPDGQDYRVYIIGDSYSDYVFPFISATFKEVQKVRINQGVWGIRFNDRKQKILDMKPDILILSISDMKTIELLKIFSTKKGN